MKAGRQLHHAGNRIKLAALIHWKIHSGIIRRRNFLRERKAASGLIITPRDLCSFRQAWKDPFPSGDCQPCTCLVQSGFAEISIVYFIIYLFHKILLKEIKKQQQSSLQILFPSQCYHLRPGDSNEIFIIYICPR